MALIVDPLPENMHVDELQIVARAKALAKPQPRLNAERAEEAAEIPPAERDAAVLDKQLRNNVTVATLVGVAEDVAALHGYLEQLERQPLVARAELLSVEQVGTGAAKGEQRFTVELLMRSPLEALPRSDEGTPLASQLP